MARRVLRGLSGKTNRRFVLAPPRQGRRVGTPRYKSRHTRVLRVLFTRSETLGKVFFGDFLL